MKPISIDLLQFLIDILPLKVIWNPDILVLQIKHLQYDLISNTHWHYITTLQPGGASSEAWDVVYMIAHLRNLAERD